MSWLLFSTQLYPDYFSRLGPNEEETLPTYLHIFIFKLTNSYTDPPPTTLQRIKGFTTGIFLDSH